MLCAGTSFNHVNNPLILLAGSGPLRVFVPAEAAIPLCQGGDERIPSHAGVVEYSCNLHQPRRTVNCAIVLALGR